MTKKDSLITVKSKSDNIYYMDCDNQYISLSSIKSDEKYENAKRAYLANYGIGVPIPQKKIVIAPEVIEEQMINTRQILFEITDACNLRCRYCGYGDLYYDHDERYSSKMTFEKIKPFIDFLEKKWKGKSKSLEKIVFISFYGGEPLLNMPFIKDMVAYTQENETSERQFRYSMTTNAMLLHKYMDFMAEHRFHLLISLDGDSNNNEYRVDAKGNNSFDRIIQNVDLLKSKYPTYFETHVNFNAVLHNKNSVSDVYNYISKRYRKTPRIGELNNMGILPEKQEEFNLLYRNKQESLNQSENYEKIEKDMFLNAPSYNDVGIFLHQYSGFLYKTYNDLLYPKRKEKYLTTGTCHPFSRKIFVTVNGKILPCERIGQQFSLGKIHKNGVELNFEDIAMRFNNWLSKINNQCRKCFRIDSCVQCIFNINDLDSKRPVCHGFMGAKEFAYYVVGNMSFLEKHPEEYQRIMNEVIIA